MFPEPTQLLLLHYMIYIPATNLSKRWTFLLCARWYTGIGTISQFQGIVAYTQFLALALTLLLDLTLT